MKCDEIRELISCMLDNELRAEDSAKVTEHLADCPECMRVFEAFHAISLSLDQMEEVPEDFSADVMHKVQRAAQKKTKTRKNTHLRFVRTTAMAACAALVFLAGSRFVSTPLYAGGGGLDVANFIRTNEDTQFTPVTPTPALTLFGTDDEIIESPNAGLMTMGLEEDELQDTEENAAVTPDVSEVPEVTPTSLPEITPTPVPVITPTPVPVVTPTPVPSPALTMQSDLLIAAEPARVGMFTHAPVLELVVTDSDGAEHALALWIDGERIYCEDRTTGTAYYTIGTPDQLAHLTGLPVATPEVSPTLAP